MNVKIGDVVTRILAGSIPMELRVTEITDKLVICGPWTFDKETGAEIDDDCGWDNEHTGSFLNQ
jgi:hypothetical protein